MKRFRFANRLVALLFTVVAGAGTVHAQGDPELSGLMQIAPPQVNSQLAIPYGYVDLTNGNLHLSIPYKTQAGPNGRSTTLSLNYNSRAWQEFSAPPNEFWTTTADYGWQTKAGADRRITYRQTNIDIGYCNHDDDIEPYWDDIAYSDGVGTHVFPFTFTQNCNAIGSTTGKAYAQDNSGYYATISTDAYGSPMGGTTQIWSPSGDLVFKGNLFGSTTQAVDANGTSLDYVPANWPSLGSNVTTATEYMYVPASALTMGAVSAINTEWANVKSVTLPDGRSFSMTYDVCPNGQSCTDEHLGTLKTLTLPTGGTLTFGYDTFTTPDNSENTAAEIRVTSVSLSGETAGNCGSTSGTTWALCWHSTAPAYARYFTGVDVTEPTGTNGSRSLSTRDLTSYFSGGSSQNWYVSDLKTYAGSSASGTPLEEIAYSGFNDTFPTDISAYHDGALISKMHYTLWDPMLPMISSAQQQDASGNILRETKYTFLPPVGTNLHPGTPTVHYIDRPQTMLVYGAGGSSGTAVAGVNFSYDTGSLSTTSGFNGHSVTGLSWHDDANFSSGMTNRGNLTSVARMSAGGAYVTTNSMSYNILGQLIFSTDGNGNTTQHDWYSDSFADSACASSTQFFFDTSMKNAKNQISRTIYDSCTGTVHAQKTPNDVAANRNGAVFTYDAGGRLTSTTLPDGGSTGVQYTDGGNSYVTTTVQVASGKTTQSITHLDSFGRTSQTEQVVAAADGGNVKTEVTVDFSGAPATVRGPYSTNRPGGTTTYVYDALHRTASTSRQGITQSQVTYSGLTITTQDGRGNSTVTTSNLLGQLVSTKEAGNQLTEYGYDALGNLNTVTQHGNGSETAVVRSFSYDPLSRLVQAYNPESGWTCYGSLSSGSKPNGSTCPGDASHTGYDGNNNLIQKTDARGVVTYFGYDPLNRLKSRGTGAATAINSCYLYDTDTATNPAESLGLLVAEWTQLGSCDSNATTVPNSSGVKTIHKIGAYDQVGRVLSESSCVMGSCSTARGQSYGYNLDGSLKTAGNGMGSPNALTMGYDSAGRLSSYSASAFGTQANLGFRYGPVGWTWGSMGTSIFLERSFDFFNRVTGMTAKPRE